jgi:FADH2 O2-dependent halogenase
MAPERYDIAILGSGFSGSLMAMVARRLGFSALLLERGRHPRFAIGESTSPLANLLLEEIAREYDLPRLLPLTGYGKWKLVYPGLTVGLKRGFTFIHHSEGVPFFPDPARGNQLLVAASPSDTIADTHWYRAELDAFLAAEAEALGVTHLQETAITGWARHGEEIAGQGSHCGAPFSFRARLVIDASGGPGALHGLAPFDEQSNTRLRSFPCTSTVFAHFTPVDQFANQDPRAFDGAPYPVDDAAMHHLFDGGWVWVLRFENGVTSAGAVLTPKLAARVRPAEGGPAWTRLLELFPSLQQQFHAAEPVTPFYTRRRLAFRIPATAIAGPGFAALPSAAAFVDPLFSTGFPLTLLGIQRLGRALAEHWDRPSLQGALREYSRVTRREAAWTAELVAACYRSFACPPRFAETAMVYFAAASFSEMARRVGNRELASEFLLASSRDFRQRARSLFRGNPDGNGSGPTTGALLEPFNVAGLCVPAKHNWYGVDLEDVVKNRSKLGASAKQIERWREQTVAEEQELSKQLVRQGVELGKGEQE